jgi:hypothetical protein
VSPQAKQLSRLGKARAALKDAQEHLMTAERMMRPSDADGQLQYAIDRAQWAIDQIRTQKAMLPRSRSEQPNG